jgi:glutamate synthase (NADPH/NADH) large chain
MINGLRGRVSVQVDGQMKTGRDVVIAALLGAEEFGFATAPLVVSGCIMMRVCHLDTCPVGVATQNPILRSRFEGQAEHVVNFFEFLAEEVREYLAALGFRSMDEAIGHSEFIDVNRAISHWKADGLDLSPILAAPSLPSNSPKRRETAQDHELERHFDHKLIEAAKESLSEGKPTLITLPISNVDQAVGTMLGNEITKRFGEAGLPEATIDVRLTGEAGQSFGAFLPRGVKLTLEGDANDYVGKGLSGGSIVVLPNRASIYPAEKNIIAGNVIGYGATSGTILLRGMVGERFLVRNSGASAVVEGVGDHALEYMTGGKAVIIGSTGRNLGAGMSGGVAYVYKLRADRINQDALAGRELRLEQVNGEHAASLRELLEKHASETGSLLAAKILENFDTALADFTLVLPSDYSSVLEIRAGATARGVDPDSDEIWQKILEVTHG